MKTVAARFFLVAAALAYATPASAELDLTRAEVSHLPNGLTVIMLEDHSFPLVSVQMLYKSGSAAETSGKTGLAHFLEHLAFRGSENFPRARATELIYDAGGEWHGYTAMDQTTYFATMPKDQLDLLLRVEADRMARVVIDPASIEAEKGAVITELHGYENDPASVLLESVTRTALQAHPYGSPMAGYVSDVAALTIEDARTYYASHYAPGNAVLAIVGDFTTAQAKVLATRDFADVPARTVAEPNLTVEPPQRGERRTQLSGPVDRQYFQLAFPAPAASSADWVPFLLLQEILSGGSGLNPHQRDFSGTPATEGSNLFGATNDIATWLLPTRDAFLFTISGSIAADGNATSMEHDIAQRIASLRAEAVTTERLSRAKAAVVRAVAEDVQTTEDAAHQLAYFEGIGALDRLLDMQNLIAGVTSADIQRVAQSYLAPEKLTVGWMVPGSLPGGPNSAASPRNAADRPGEPTTSTPASQPQLRNLTGGLPAIVQTSDLSNTVTVEILMSAPIEGGAQPPDLQGIDALVRSGPPNELARLLKESAEAASNGQAPGQSQSDDLSTRLEQLIAARIAVPAGAPPKPLAVIVSGKIDREKAFGMLERVFGAIKPAERAAVTASPPKPSFAIVREQIPKPLSQGAIGYVVEGPAAGTREALAWRMLLYVLTHDYSGRLGWSAISDKGITYHIYSQLQTDGARTWATLSTGIDPDKANAMEAELRAQLAKLIDEPPTSAEVDAARNHLLGRDLTAAQSNEELAGKLARELVETGGLRTHEQLSLLLQTISAADLAQAAHAFGRGTIVRVDVGAPAPPQDR